MASDALSSSRLCYLDAASVEGPFAVRGDVDVRNDGNRSIGRLDGIILDAATRHVEYLVIDAGGFFRRRRYLLPFRPVRVDLHNHSFRVDIDTADLARCETFEPRAFQRFSDDDLLAAMFPKNPSVAA